MPTNLPIYLLGLDLGQVTDPSALIGAHWQPDYPDRPRLDINLIDRIALGTSYPDIVDRVCGVTQDTRLKDRCLVAIDATGVGRPVVDMFRVARKRAREWQQQPAEEREDCKDRLFAPILPVSITAGRNVKQEGGFLLVPKRDLVIAVRVLMEQGILRISTKLPLRELLIKELDNFKMKIDPKTAHDSYGAWREGEHDDLVLGASMVAWTVFQELKKRRRAKVKPKPPPQLIQYYEPRSEAELKADQEGWTLQDLVRYGQR